MVNLSLYTSCFIGSAKSSAQRCELCQATTHTERECAQQGDLDPDMQQRVKAMESVVLACLVAASSSTARSMASVGGSV